MKFVGQAVDVKNFNLSVQKNVTDPPVRSGEVTFMIHAK
jgi:hypothetical protein